MLTTSPVRVAILCSRRAPGLAHLLDRGPRRTGPVRIVCCLTSEETFAEEPLAHARGVPIVRHDVRRFYAERAPTARLNDLRIREDYDRETVTVLEAHRPDVVVLAGYLLLLTAPMLDAFGTRMFNVHHSDLLLRNAAGGPRYPGLRAVRDAILAGEPETRSTAHLLTDRLDDGPLLVRSWPYPVPAAAVWAHATGAHDILRPMIWAHQEWMLRSAFGPVMDHAIDLVADGALVKGCGSAATIDPVLTHAASVPWERAS